MRRDIENIYQDILINIGRAGKVKLIYLVYSTKQGGGDFICITEGSYRENLIDTEYQLIATYSGQELPRFSQIYGDIHAFIKEESEKGYGVRSGLQEFAIASMGHIKEVGS